MELKKSMRVALHAARVLRLLSAVTAALLFLSVALGQEQRPGEYQVKAAYLYDFSRFIKWPTKLDNRENHPFAICVLGKDPFGPILDDTLAGQRSAGQSLIARRLSKPQDAHACRILFIGASETDHLKEILAQTNKISVLTVSDIPRFSDRGGMIEFVLKDQKVRFNVNLTNAMDAGLSVSSDLLKVALRVTRNSPPGD